MTFETKISVIIPTYNRSTTIEYCIKSILTQSYQNFEIIVADDCSTDNTLEIVNSINDERINVVKLDKNCGAQAARNIGIKNAKYDWIAFQDSDDEWLNDKLERQIKELEKVNFNRNYVIHGNCEVYNHQDNQKTIWNLPIIEGSCYIKLLTNPAPVFPAILVSKEALIRINYLDESVPSYQEWDTSIRLSKYYQFIHIQEPLFIYHLHKGDTISKDLTSDIIGYQYILNKFKHEIINNCGLDSWENHLNIQFNKLSNFEIFTTQLFDLTSKQKDLILSIFSELKANNNSIIQQKNEIERKYNLIVNSLSYRVLLLILNPIRKLIEYLPKWNKK